MSKAKTYASEPTGTVLIAGLSASEGCNIPADTVRYILHVNAGKQCSRRIATIPHQRVYSQTILPIVTVEKGVIKDFSYPTNDFYHVQDGNGKDIIVFSGIEPEKEHDSYAKEFADVAEHFKTKMLYVVGSTHEPLPHTREPLFYAFFMNPRFSILEGFDFPSYRGLANINQLLVAEAHKRGIDALEIGARVPFYIHGQNPKGVRALLRRISEHSKLEFDLKVLEEAVQKIEDSLGHAMQEGPPQFSEMVKSLEDMYDTQTKGDIKLSPEIERYLRSLGLS